MLKKSKLKLASIIALSFIMSLTVYNQKLPEENTKAAYKAPNIVYKENEPISFDRALNLLKEGNNAYVEDELDSFDVSNEKRAELKQGQHPFAVIVTCSDSRVPPELIFNQGLGKLFTVRVAGNVVDSDEIGSIEYAVEHLHSPLIVVMGHDSCGAVKATVESVTNGTPLGSPHLEAIASKIKPAVKTAIDKKLQGDKLLDACIDENIKNVVNKLKQSSQIINDGLSQKEIKLVKAKYSLSSGRVNFFE